MKNLEPAQVRHVLRSREDLLRGGHTARGIDAALAAGAIRRVRRGWFVDTGVWNELWPESRHLLHLAAVWNDSRSAAVAASHHSAAVLWGLPLYRTPLPRVHLTTDVRARISSGRDVVRHLHPLAPTDVAERHGIRCTSLERTVFDLARVLPAEAALAAADAALRMRAVRRNEQDAGAAEEWRDELNGRLRDAAGARGIRQARWIAEIADGRAQLPGESVSRLHLLRLGFEHLDLQVPVGSPSGGSYWVDVGFDDQKAWGEFDGATKYIDEAMRSGRTIEQVMLDEKQREDWIRGTTHRRFARWGDAHIRSAEVLGARLASFGIFAAR